MNDLHPAIQTAIRYFSTSPTSLQAVAAEFGITKQAASKRIERVRQYLLAFDQPKPEDPRIAELEDQLARANELIRKLRLRLVICRTLLFLSEAFKEMVLKFFPKLKLTRLGPYQKKYLLDMLQKYVRYGGKARDFCKQIDKSPDTLRNWQANYDRYGMAGLIDKKSRPRYFSKKLPLWLRQQILALFIRYPHWTPWQFHKHMAHNPAINWSVSIPTIKKLHSEHRQRSEEEKTRIKKLWCFAGGFDVWTLDFTTIHQCDRYQLRLLTVSDQRSRFLLDSALFLHASTEQVMDHLMELFIKYGKPWMIKVDGGPEFRMEFREQLSNLSTYVLQSPRYYGQFCGAHERMHRTIKSNIESFAKHKNLSRLLHQIEAAQHDCNYLLPLDYLDKRTPASVFYTDPDFIPKDREVVHPYIKDNELRMRYTGRNGRPAKTRIPIIPTITYEQESTT